MNTKRSVRVMLLVFLVAGPVMLCGCVSWLNSVKPPEPEPETVEVAQPEPTPPKPPVTEEWLREAQLIEAKNGTIYYLGETEGEMDQDGYWIGTIEGDVFFKSPEGLITRASRIEFSKIYTMKCERAKAHIGSEEERNMDFRDWLLGREPGQ